MSHFSENLRQLVSELQSEKNFRLGKELTLVFHRDEELGLGLMLVCQLVEPGKDFLKRHKLRAVKTHPYI